MRADRRAAAPEHPSRLTDLAHSHDRGTMVAVSVAKTLRRLGFDKRVKGSHHLFRKSGVEERINLQREGNNAKPYQVEQVRAVILKYKLGGAE